MNTSYLDRIGGTVIQVYKDESCLDLLSEYERDFRVEIVENPAEFEETLLFEFLCEVEEEFQRGWGAVAIFDGRKGIVLYRNKHYLLNFKYQPKLKVNPRIIYFDVTDINLLRNSFSTAIVYEIERSPFYDLSDFIFGRDEFVLRLVERLNYGEKSYVNAVVVIAHEGKSETLYELSADYGAKIKIKDAQHLEDLEKLYQGFTLSSRILMEACDCVLAAEFYGVDPTPFEQAKNLADTEISRIKSCFQNNYR